MPAAWRAGKPATAARQTRAAETKVAANPALATEQAQATPPPNEQPQATPAPGGEATELPEEFDPTATPPALPPRIASRSRSAATAGNSTLMATSRLRAVSLPRYTSPMPPLPISGPTS